MTSWLGRATTSSESSEPVLRDGLIATAIGFALRLIVALWAAARFPPSEDGHFYHAVASRIARGLGYTWLWPDGAVTYAAHYPVGYPAIVALGYALFGPHPVVAMLENAALGALAVLAVHRIASVEGSRATALFAALAAAVHPGLVFYTPALMTEGAAASLCIVAAWFAVRARSSATPLRELFFAGAMLGVATLVRPQSLMLAPLYGALSPAGPCALSRVRRALLVTAIAIAACLPWTARNCARVNSCVLVSANAGWNLFIGAADKATGAWVALDQLGVPEACRTVWGEAEKDACFGRAGRQAILEHPGQYLALVPRKLGITFDYAGAAGWYLHASNASAFDDRDKVVLGVVETVFERLLLLVGLAAAAMVGGPRRVARKWTAVFSIVFLFTKSGWVSYVGLVTSGALLGRRIVERPALFIASATVFATALTHAVFFGAGRYSLVCFPALSALSGLIRANRRGFDRQEPPGR
jgi:4-amino-4-deoxy-L-arabinose transferase-like glycosyltransferase